MPNKHILICYERVQFVHNSPKSGAKVVISFQTARFLSNKLSSQAQKRVYLYRNLSLFNFYIDFLIPKTSQKHGFYNRSMTDSKPSSLRILTPVTKSGTHPCRSRFSSPHLIYNRAFQQKSVRFSNEAFPQKKRMIPISESLLIHNGRITDLLLTFKSPISAPVSSHVLTFRHPNLNKNLVTYQP